MKKIIISVGIGRGSFLQPHDFIKKNSTFFAPILLAFYLIFF